MSFLEAAYYESNMYGLNQPVAKLMNLLTSNESLIISSENAKMIEDYENSMVLPFEFKKNSTFSETLNYTIAGTYQYWPLMSPMHPTREICVIGSLGLYSGLVNRGYFNPIENLLLIDIKGASDQISSSLQDILPNSEITTIDTLMGEDKSNALVIESLLPIINSDFVICIGIVVVGLVMFGFHGYIERGKEIGIEKALGMSNRQIAYTFVVEFAVLVFFGILYGTLIGVFIVEIILNIFNLGTQYEPTSAIYYPISFFTGFLVIIVILGFLGVILPIYWSTKREISSVLKVE